MPLAYFFDAGFAIRFLVWTQIIRIISTLRVGQCAECRFCPVSYIDRVVSAFENENDLPVTMFFSQCNDFLCQPEIALRG